jgi:hypothetical protein
MSPAPETIRRQSNPSASPSLSISTILSRPPRAPSDAPGPFSADRRAGIRRNFSGGPRPAPFSRSNPSAAQNRDTEDIGSTQALLISALETRRRRIEELRNGSSPTNIASSIAEQWRRRDSIRARSSGSPELEPQTPIPRTPSPRIFENDPSDSESEDDDPDNKFSSSMNEIRSTPPPTFITPNTSPETTTTSPHAEDDSSRNAYTLSCKFCANVLTRRGMRARLVADARIHIWSTDEKPSVKLVGSSYATTTCQCQLMYLLLPNLMVVILRVTSVRRWWDIILLGVNLVRCARDQTIMPTIIC